MSLSVVTLVDRIFGLLLRSLTEATLSTTLPFNQPPFFSFLFEHTLHSRSQRHEGGVKERGFTSFVQPKP
jgi:hypothetical protein